MYHDYWHERKVEKTMQYTKLGNSELTVSRICMGCMGFGDASNGQHSWTVDEAQSREIIHRGLELGINFFDTAMGYQNGTSEEYLGRAIRSMARRAISASPTASRGSWPKPTRWRSGRNLQNSSPCRDITI